MRPTFPRWSARLHLKMVRQGLNALAGCYITPRHRPPARLCKRVKHECARQGRSDQACPLRPPKTSGAG